MSGKKHWKNVDLTFQFSSTKKTNWADVKEEAPLDVNVIRSNLPTQTNATRQSLELNNLSSEGPFILNFYNVPFETKEDDLKMFFKDCVVNKVMLNERKRGSGWIEFDDLSSLKEALALNEKYFRSRVIRLSIASGDDVNRTSGGSGGGKYRNQTDSRSNYQTLANMDESDNWRGNKPPQPNTQDDMFKRGSAVSGTGRQPQFTGPSGSWKGTKKPLQAQGPPQGGGNKSLDEMDNWRRSKGADNPPVARKAVTQDVSDSEPVKEVKEMKKVSIFGDAKPIDTTAKLMEIEEKIEKRRQSGEIKITTETPPPSKANSLVIGSKLVKSGAAFSETSTTSQQQSSPVSDKLEWRSGPRAIPNPPQQPHQVQPTRQTSGNKSSSFSIHKAGTESNSIVTAQQPPAVEDKKKAEPAPLPLFNVWEERKKKNQQSKNNIPSPTTINDVAPSKNITIMKQQPSTADNNNNAAASVNSIAANANSSNTVVRDIIKDNAAAAAATAVIEKGSRSANSLSASSSGPETVLPSPQKQPQPVIISANGPFLDPKANKTQQQLHYFVTDERPIKPKVIPNPNRTTSTLQVVTPAGQQNISLAINQGSVDKGITQLSTKVTPTNPSVNSVKKINPASSWAKGPPKTLIEKSESVQNPIDN